MGISKFQGVKDFYRAIKQIPNIPSAHKFLMVVPYPYL